jgi:hypothetical protein
MVIKVTHPDKRQRIPAPLPRKVVLYIFGILVVISCLLLLPYLRAKKSMDWPSTPGVVTKSWVNVIYNSRVHQQYFRAEIRYRYRVGSTEYEGKDLSLAPMKWSTLQSAQALVDRFPVAKSVRIYYDPRHASSAILQPGLFGEMELVYKLDLILIVGGVLGFVITLLGYRDREESHTLDLQAKTPSM